jgi:hypothetical protein
MGRAAWWRAGRVEGVEEEEDMAAGWRKVCSAEALWCVGGVGGELFFK